MGVKFTNVDHAEDTSGLNSRRKITSRRFRQRSSFYSSLLWHFVGRSTNIALFSDENNTATHQSSNASYSDSVALWNADKDVMPPSYCAQDWKKTLSDFAHIFTGFVLIFYFCLPSIGMKIWTNHKTYCKSIRIRHITWVYIQSYIKYDIFNLRFWQGFLKYCD